MTAAHLQCRPDPALDDGWSHMDRLARILESEIASAPVDREQGALLAEELARLFPEIGGSMTRIARRLAGRC